MTISSRHNGSASRTAHGAEVRPSPSGPTADRQMSRWGGAAGLAGVVCMIVTVVVIGAMGLPDASDVETLTDFADIESGRIAEHFLYLSALVLFALHVLVLRRLLDTAHPAAALFGTAIAEFGLVIMAASSLLHVSTSPLAELYTEPGATAEELQSIEYAWHGAQSVFDTMLSTGVLLVPIGIVLLGTAMWHAPAFGPRLTWLALTLGTIGIVGAAIAVVDPGSQFSAVSVLAIVAFYLSTGWRALAIGNKEHPELTDREPTPDDTIAESDPR